MSAVRTVAISARLAFRSLFAWNTPALFVIVLLITPLLQMAFFVLLGQSLEYRYPTYFVIGLALQGATAGSVGGLVSTIAEERGFGTLLHIVVSPASRVAVFVGRMAPGVLSATGVAVLSSVFGLLFVGWPFDAAGSAVFLGAILASSFSGAALGLCLSSVGLIFRDIYQLALIAHFALLVLTGATIARGDLPIVLQWVGGGLPLTHAIDAARRLAEDGVQADSAALLGVELVVGCAWLLLALALTVVLERASRRTGALDVY